MKIATIIGMIFTGLAYWPGVGIESYFCAAHPGETWDPLAGSPESKRCSKTTYWGITQGACAIAIDIYIFILLIPAIIALQLAPRRKLQVLGVFTTAFLYVVCRLSANPKLRKFKGYFSKHLRRSLSHPATYELKRPALGTGTAANLRVSYRKRCNLSVLILRLSVSWRTGWQSSSAACLLLQPSLGLTLASCGPLNPFSHDF